MKFLKNDEKQEETEEKNEVDEIPNTDKTDVQNTLDKNFCDVHSLRIEHP